MLQHWINNIRSELPPKMETLHENKTRKQRAGTLSSQPYPRKPTACSLSFLNTTWQKRRKEKEVN